MNFHFPPNLEGKDYSIVNNNIIFIQAFLGQKYGFVAVPYQIPRAVFEMLLTTLREKGEDVELLCTWYKLDYNALANVYVLQPISSVLGKSEC